MNQATLGAEMTMYSLKRSFQSSTADKGNANGMSKIDSWGHVSNGSTTSRPITKDPFLLAWEESTHHALICC
jgi:hypothetical protein